MKIPSLTIGKLTVEIPIVQGGMGVKVSMSELAAAVSNAGGIGTISSIGLGGIENSKTRYVEESREALQEEIRKAKSMTDKPIAVNVMGVMSNADDLVITASKAGTNFIMFGAGIPMRLPSLVQDNTEVNLVPIVSSAKLANLLCRNWDKSFNRIPDAFILEGPEAGGHLGFSLEQLNDIENNSLSKILPEVLETIKPFEDKYGRKIPVIPGGGIFDGEDIVRMLKLGASGVQMASRFVCTDECKVSDEFKQAYINAEEEDIQIIKSPVGMPGRAIRNKFLISLEGTKQKINCPYRCLTMCNASEAQYCIALALTRSHDGDTENGLVFAGAKTYRIKKIVKVSELMEELKQQILAAE